MHVGDADAAGVVVRVAGEVDLVTADMVKDGLSAPLHEGAVRYYKEKGWIK